MAALATKLTAQPMTPELFSKAYQKGYDLTVRFLISKGAKVEEAEELAQAAWARGWEYRHQLQQTDRILPWVNTIAFHHFCSERRRFNRYDELKETRDRRPGPDAAAASIDANRLMEQCSEVDRKLLTDRYYNGMEMEEIAKRHGLTTVTTRVRLHRCKAALREKLSAAEGRRLAEVVEIRSRKASGSVQGFQAA